MQSAVRKVPLLHKRQVEPNFGLYFCFLLNLEISLIQGNWKKSGKMTRIVVRVEKCKKEDDSTLKFKVSCFVFSGMCMF